MEHDLVAVGARRRATRRRSRGSRCGHRADGRGRSWRRPAARRPTPRAPRPARPPRSRWCRDARPRESAPPPEHVLQLDDVAVDVGDVEQAAVAAGQAGQGLRPVRAGGLRPRACSRASMTGGWPRGERPLDDVPLEERDRARLVHLGVVLEDLARAGEVLLARGRDLLLVGRPGIARRQLVEQRVDEARLPARTGRSRPRSPLGFVHQLDEAIEQVARIVRSGRRFGVVLHAEDGQAIVAHALDGVGRSG